MGEYRIGTAGWNIPAFAREHFPETGSLLERYAVVFSGVEINSTFYRPHRAATYARWAQSVPETFRFALKVPKEITHERRFADIDEPLLRFLGTSAELGAKRDVLLVQLPPSFAYDVRLAEDFFVRLRTGYGGRIACEARHASWFDEPAAAMLEAHGVVRVEADPPAVPVPERAQSSAFRYVRLHGSPRIYYSEYSDAALAEIARDLSTATVAGWCIFDNTAAGAATSDALALMAAPGLGRIRRDGSNASKA
jgi:uncharacterized protein YecE (DUF72 family)